MSIDFVIAFNCSLVFIYKMDRNDFTLQLHTYFVKVNEIISIHVQKRHGNKLIVRIVSFLQNVYVSLVIDKSNYPMM